ncbi:MAG: tetratricopeptide repeat protein [Microcoleus sp.]
MGIICGAIREDFDGDMEAYWLEHSDDPLVETDLKNLVTSQFDRLQELDPEAYKLLCRLGCYRYQDVPTVSAEGLFCLLWDVPEASRRQMVKSLLHRSLLECQKGEYWLHPGIREEAIERMSPEDWTTANRKAAEFWAQSVESIESIEDALKAFEAYYQYVAINSFEDAANVIIKKINTQFSTDDRLGRALFNLGLLQPIISATTRIVNNISSDYYLSGLYSILGVCYRIEGDIEQAVHCHQLAEQKSMRCLQSPPKGSDAERMRENLETWKWSALLNIGFCKIELGEFPAAKEIFVKLKFKADTISIARDSIDIGLAFLHSQAGEKKEAAILLKNIESEIDREELVVTGYKLIFLAATYKNLGNADRALCWYCQAVTPVEQSQYNPVQTVKAKAHIGIAEIYRDRKDFDRALLHHSEAIEILDKVNAKCGLAEAYYQQGITYQIMEETEKSQGNFEKAIELFEEITAPKQIEKVRSTLDSYQPKPEKIHKKGELIVDS